MNLNELRQRIAHREDLHTEFKEWPVHNDDLAAALTAFANTDGGQLILGVDKDRRVIGVADADLVMRTIDSIAYQNCEPPLAIVQESILADETTVVVVNIPKGDQKPYRTNRGVYYTRTSSGRRQTSRQELLRLFQASESMFYDETPVLRANVDDIEITAFTRFIEQTYSQRPEEFPTGLRGLLRNLRLVQEVGGELYPTLACLLFFGCEPQRFLPHAHLVAARIPGQDLAASPTDLKRIDGTLPVIFENAARFLNIHLPTRHYIQGFEPETFPELPEVALRETLVNALAHRDYTVTGPIRVLIFDDRVEVRTPGSLPNTVTVAAIKLGGAHVLRNPTIYLLFSRLGLVTGLGSGVFRVIQLVRAATGREPDISEQGNELLVALPRPARRDQAAK
jgi:ATP-dependent DNA helicase RecG